MNFLLLTLLLAILLGIFMLFRRERENFSNNENMMIYNLFRDNQQMNGTFYDFRKMMNRKNIAFSQKSYKNGADTERDLDYTISFRQYLDMLRHYNKGTLTISAINVIRG